MSKEERSKQVPPSSTAEFIEAGPYGPVIQRFKVDADFFWTFTFDPGCLQILLWRNNVGHQEFCLKETHPTGGSGSHRQMVTSLFDFSVIGVMVLYRQH